MRWGRVVAVCRCRPVPGWFEVMNTSIIVSADYRIVLCASSGPAIMMS